MEFALREFILRIIQMIFIDYYWISFPIIYIFVIILYGYRKKIILYYSKKMLPKWIDYKRHCERKIEMLTKRIEKLSKKVK